MLPENIIQKRHRTKLSLSGFIKSDNPANKECGIYMIYCVSNNRAYIGSASKSFKRRLSVHLSSLKNNRKCCPILQDCFNKYGEASLDVTIIESIIDKSIIIKRESYYLEFILKSTSDKKFFKKYGMNICPYGSSTLGIKINPEVVARLTAKKIGRKQTIEHIENTRKANIGRVMSEDTKIKISQSNKGKVCSEYTKQKVREATTGVVNPKRKIVYRFSLEKKLIQEYAFVNQVKIDGFNPPLVSACCLGKRNVHGKSLWSNLKNKYNDIAS